MSCVLPGDEEVLASPFWPVSILISEDLPTLERPINAYSGKVAGGHWSARELLVINLASRISILFSARVRLQR